MVFTSVFERPKAIRAHPGTMNSGKQDTRENTSVPESPQQLRRRSLREESTSPSDQIFLPLQQGSYHASKSRKLSDCEMPILSQLKPVTSPCIRVGDVPRDPLRWSFEISTAQICEAKRAPITNAVLSRVRWKLPMQWSQQRVPTSVICTI